jgi:hypothetical protein
MRLRHLTPLLALSTILLSSCEKIDFGPDGGITEKSSDNVATGKIDETDWTVDSYWEKREKQLFKDLPFSIDPASILPAENFSFALYPNPVQRFASFSFTYPFIDPTVFARRILRYVIIDEQFKVKQTGNISRNTFALSFEKDKYDKGKVYRMYYVLYEEYESGASRFLAKGHGDIQIAK